MKRPSSFERFVGLLGQSVFVAALCALVGKFAAYWYHQKEVLPFLPVLLIGFLLARTIQIRFEGQEEESWATLAMGSAAIPLLCIGIKTISLCFRNFAGLSSVFFLIFVLAILGALLKMGRATLRKGYWNEMGGVVLFQGLVGFLLYAWISMDG